MASPSKKLPLGPDAARDPELAREVAEFLSKSDLARGAAETSPLARLEAFRDIVRKGGLPSLAHMLPCLLNLDGKPYSLEHHPQFEPMFSVAMPKRTVWRTGRQVSKSTGIAARGVIQAASIPRFRQLFVTPLYEQCRRLSNNYVRPLLYESPIKSLLIGGKTENSVLQKSFVNKSMMLFTFAGLSVERARGISVDAVSYDEIQDLDGSHVPIIDSAMSHSPWEVTNLTGTPKTPDNTIEEYWRASSQAEWFIPCEACGHWNVPSLEFDLLKMIGPVTSDIGPGRPGTVCARCGKPVDPGSPLAQWVHRYPDRRESFPGRHVSQPIMHIHYASVNKWSTLVGKMEGRGNYTPQKFNNEALGEAAGVGVQIISEHDLRTAGHLAITNNPRDLTLAIRHARNRYSHQVLAVDWGGGGEDWISLTTVALIGMTPTGKIEVPWGCRLLTPHAHLLEAEQVKNFHAAFGTEAIVHDYSGAGELRETFLVQSGIPRKNIIPIRYVRATRAPIMTYIKPTRKHPRAFYQLDKARSLLMTCAGIQIGRVGFFRYDYISTDETGLMRDFLALVENVIETRLGSNVYTITRAAKLSDDFAQAVNIGCCSLWHMTNSWPNVTIPNRYELSAENEKIFDGLETDNEFEDQEDGVLV